MLSCKDGDKTALISGALHEHFVIKIYVLRFLSGRYTQILMESRYGE